MKRVIFILPVTIALVTSCNNAPGNDSNTKKTGTPQLAAQKTATPAPPMDSAAIAKKAQEEVANWKEYMTPGEMQKMMASWNGKWTEETTLWMGDGVQPQTTKGTCENKMIMGGRYQLATHMGKLMDMDFEGAGTMGYDNAKKVFVSSWVDNMGTGIMYLEGPYDAATKTISLKGKVVDPASHTEKEVKQLLKIIDDKHQVLEMYEPKADGKEYKSLEIRFTRK